MHALALALAVALGTDAGTPDGGVTVEVAVKKPLKLLKGELAGRLEVRVTNASAAPVTLQHRDVHGFSFTPADGGVREVLFHSCDCGFELGLEPPPASRTFTLKPAESRVLAFDDFACAGGPYRAPPRGNYSVSYSLGPPGGERADGGFDLEKCSRLLRTRAAQQFESKAAPVTIR